MSEVMVYSIFTFLGFCLVWFFPRHKPFKPQMLINEVSAASTTVEDMKTNISAMKEASGSIMAQHASFEIDLANLKLRHQKLLDWQSGVRIPDTNEISDISKHTVAIAATALGVRLDAIASRIGKMQSELDTMSTVLEKKVDRIDENSGGTNSLAEDVQWLRAELAILKNSRRGNI
jgi:hypothetical protein